MRAIESVGRSCSCSSLTVHFELRRGRRGIERAAHARRALVDVLAAVVKMPRTSDPFHPEKRLVEGLHQVGWIGGKIQKLVRSTLMPLEMPLVHQVGEIARAGRWRR